MDGGQGVALILITGTMGAGKSSVMAEASDLLTIRHIEHAAIDLDALGVAYLSSAHTNNDAMYSNLECVCANFMRLGVRRFLVARALESRPELEFCRRAMAVENVTVCRLTANLPCLQQRVMMRESGIWQAAFVSRVRVLDAILDQASLEDFTILNEDRSVTEVARELLIRAGWLTD